MWFAHRTHGGPQDSNRVPSESGARRFKDKLGQCLIMLQLRRRLATQCQLSGAWRNQKAACAADTVDSGRAKRLRSAYECIGVDVPLAGPVGADARPSWKAGLMPAGNGDAVSSTRSEVGPLPKSESGSKGERASSHTLDGGEILHQAYDKRFRKRDGHAEDVFS